MANRSVYELPDGPYKSILEEARKRGLSLLDGVKLDASSTFIIGLADIIRELQNDVRYLEKG